MRIAREDKDKKEFEAEFEGVGDVLDYVTEKGYFTQENHSREPNTFAGNDLESWDTAVERMRCGRPDLAQELFDDIKAIKSDDDIESDELRYDVVGDVVDVGRYLTGHPEHWMVEKETGTKGCVEVVVNVSMSHYIDRNLIKNRGAAVTALIDRLSKDYVVSVVIAWEIHHSEYRHNYEDWEMITRVQLPNNPLDIDAIAYMLADDTYLRRIMFATLERQTGHENCSGYGSPRDMILSKTDGIYFGSSQHRNWNESDFRTLESAKRKVEKIYNEYVSK